LVRTVVNVTEYASPVDIPLVRITKTFVVRQNSQVAMTVVVRPKLDMNPNLRFNCCL